jgi:hypothetical protein
LSISSVFSIIFIVLYSLQLGAGKLVGCEVGQVHTHASVGAKVGGGVGYGVGRNVGFGEGCGDGDGVFGTQATDSGITLQLPQDELCLKSWLKPCDEHVV